MQPIHDPVTGELRYPYTYEGVVVDNADPQNRHRIRARIPGMIDMTAWARPRTIGGGNAQAGFNIVPPKGADVFIDFVGGDVERPIYTGGPWASARKDGVNEMPTSTQGVPDASQIAVLEFANYLITIDGTKGKPTLSILDKVSGDGLILDVNQLQTIVRGSSLLLLHADAQLVIEAAEVVINGRKVLPSAKAI